MLYPGRFLEPSDIVMLARVCATVCEERGVPVASRAGERTAAHVLRLFLNGLTGENELIDAEKNWARGSDLAFERAPVSYENKREAA